MNEKLTIESFFIDEYLKLKQENEALRKKSGSDAGLVDLHEPIEAVEVVASLERYGLFRAEDAPFHEHDEQQLSSIIDMDDGELQELLENTESRYRTPPLKTNKLSFPFSVEFRSYRGTELFGFDPDASDDSSKFVPISTEPEYNELVIENAYAGSIAKALFAFRKAFQERIKEIR